MAKYLITGYKGQLGFDIERELKKRDITDITADWYLNNGAWIDNILSGEYKNAYKGKVYNYR